ncbi:FG-GAP-like repeat-containing protein [Primorskyibacter sp. 2E107]|uniref:FG-GAP-like repeat-containing protein n=1 Tax=Primorskyibacter sp. 2E107 TaxID=3403458 RepID=UPI003AF69FB2
MDTFVSPPYQKRFFLAVLIVAVLAYLFWTGSRYPALNEKAMMSGAIQLEDPLSFEAKYPLTAAMGTVEKIYYSTLNWINTNKKGMTFGLLFAAAFMTAMGYLRQRSFKNGFANSFMGMFIGAPLGVCANCVAPIGKGMYSSGMRAEMTLSTMVASPTLNIVVLSMLFSLLPFYMAVTKIALSIFVILIAVPLICRALPSTQIDASKIKPVPWAVDEFSAERESIFKAAVAVVLAYLKNLWYILKLTVPLMILAGFLGAVVGTLLPQDLVMNLGFGIGILALVTLFGLFMPVPIAFDVVLAGALIAAGLSHGYVMALVFTLGSFSIYSFFIVTQAIGPRAAVMMAATIAVLGFGAGIGANAYQEWRTEEALRLLTGEADQARPAPYMWGAAQAAGMADLPHVTSEDADRITVDAKPFVPPSPAAGTGFTRMEASEIGIDKPVEFTMRDMWPPFWEGRSLSSADYDHDGDTDLAVASTEVGLYLYANDGSGQFARVDVDLGDLADMPIFNAVLADLDNDGWQDLFLATYLDGNYWLRNVEGSFGAEPAKKVPNIPEAPLSMAVSLADIDSDGYLDVALGNWAAGWYRRIPGEESRNAVLLNKTGALDQAEVTALPGIPGETLSILFSDFDDNGTQDLIVGNDFDVPDYFYRGDGQGGLDMITEPEGLIPHTTTTTMAVKSADMFNEGHSGIYLAQIAGRSSGVSRTLKMQPLGRYCDGIADSDARGVCERNMAIKTWYRSGNSFDPTYASRCEELEGRYKTECKAMLIKDLAIQRRDPGLCDLIPADQPIPAAYCTLHFKPARQPLPEEIALTHQQILRSNVMLEWQDGKFEDTASERGLDVGGWSWDTKIADFDQDGLQDMYIVNGTWVPNEVSPSNLFFHNTGTGFEEASGPFGLEDYLMTASATAFDMDGDGDLDMITHPVNGPLAVFRNNTQKPGLAIRLQDGAGNVDGIGARVTLVGQDGGVQSRELQLGGGFMSFDAPVAHFGLGAAESAAEARVRWPDGAVTVLAGPILPGRQYTVTRQ